MFVELDYPTLYLKIVLRLHILSALVGALICSGLLPVQVETTGGQTKIQ